MPNTDFSGIPALDDTAGMEQYMSNATLNTMGLGNDSTPSALQMNQQTQETAAQTNADTNAQAQPAANANGAPQYTAEQVAQIIAQNQQLQMQQAQQMQAMQMQQAQMAQRSPYTPQQAQIIKTLIDRGVPMERIQAALASGNANAAAQSALADRVRQLEARYEQAAYAQAQGAFIDKMTSFGDKFGLSESDLVTFGNKAMSMGINLIDVNDVEAVFRAVYPDQYAIRSQRIASSPVSTIYGGSSITEAPRASAAKMEDAYVDSFLKSSMPNQYGMFKK